MNDPAVIEEMLRTARTIAVVGMSDKTWRASHNIGRYLAGKGYRVLPVNPALTTVLDMQCYPSLEAAEAAIRAEGNGGIDLVDVFRCPDVATLARLLVDGEMDGAIESGVSHG